MCGQNTSRQWKSGNIQNQLTIPRATMIQSNQLGLVIIFFIGLSVNLSQNFACFYFTLTIDSWWWWLSKCQKCCRIWKKRSKVKKLRKRISFRFRMVSIIIKYTYICTKKKTLTYKKNREPKSFNNKCWQDLWMQKEFIYSFNYNYQRQSHQ